MTPTCKPYSLKLNPVFFKNWFALYLWTLLFFAPFIINFLWGNHDWGWVKDETPLLSGVFEGRFSQFILQTMLFSGKILPVLTLCIALLFFALAALLLLDLWQIPQKSIYIITLSLFLITSPYILSWLYFAFIILSNLTWPLAIIIACKLLNQKPSPINFSLSVILFTLALGGYPPVINMVGVIFFATALINLCFDKLSPTTILKKYIPHVLSAALAVFFFLITQYFLKKYGLQNDTYNTASISFTNIPEKLTFCISTAIKQFITPTSFINNFYKYTTLLLCLTAAVKLFQNLPHGFSAKLTFILLMSGMLLSSVITVFLSENTGYVLFEPRIEFYGLLYIYFFSFAVLLKTTDKLAKNVTFSALILLLWYNFSTLSEASKVWKFGMFAETNLANRFLSRLEQNKNFSLDFPRYTFIQSGTLSLRPKYYHSPTAQKADSYTLTAPYIPWHLPTKAYQFYYPTSFTAMDFDVYWSFIPFDAPPHTPEFIRYIKENAAPWPHQNAIYIDHSHIILTLSPDGIWRASQWLDNNF
ncbi:MAG: hypothetical protein J6A09_02700 [Alphaproteobacteria bacterium]|nr:hypothetical protein [Alphaproteobacteria bacterium]